MRRVSWSSLISALVVTVVVTGGLIAGCKIRDTTPESPAERLTRETGSEWLIDIDPETGTPELLAPKNPIAPSAINGVKYEDAALAFLVKYHDLISLDDANRELVLEDSFEVDGEGHVRFQQTEGGLPIDGQKITVHFAADKSIVMIAGSTRPDAKKAVGTPAVTADAAFATIEGNLKSRFPNYDRAWLKPGAAPKLVLLPAGRGAALAWAMDLEVASDAVGTNMVYRIDGTSGAIVLGYEDRPAILGSGQGVYTNRQIEVSPLAGGYVMVRVGDGTKTFISTRDFATTVAIQSNDLSSWDPRSPTQAGAGAAVDAHANLAIVDHFFRDLGWASYDGKGGDLRVYVHDSVALNAFWNKQGAIRFGDGEGIVKPLSASLDICAHEYMHGVTQYMTRLRTDGEPGALNEAISDIFGAFVEFTEPPAGSDRFLVGELSFPGGLRNMAHPNVKICNPPRPGPGGDTCPDNYDNLYTGDEDKGGVHINANIVNNAWYLMTKGGTNDTSHIEVKAPLGWQKSQKLWWATLRHGSFYEGTKIRQAAEFLTAEAKKLFGAEGVKAVGCAWVATGVLTNDYIKRNYNELKVSCGCFASDGGVAKPEDLPCCDDAHADAGDNACCKTCTPEAGTDGPGATTKCLCNYTAPPMSDSHGGNACKAAPKGGVTQCAPDDLYFSDGRNGESCSGYDYFSKTELECICYGDPTGHRLCKSKWKLNPATNANECQEPDGLLQPATDGASCNGYYEATNESEPGKMGNCTNVAHDAAWNKVDGMYKDCQ